MTSFSTPIRAPVDNSKFENKIFGREKGVTIFHVAWVKYNCRRNTPNGYQKFDITEKTIILNFIN